MKLVRHITFWFDENRISSINTIIDSMNSFNVDTIDIFIHTNRSIDLTMFINNQKGNIHIIIWSPDDYTLSHHFPFGYYLTFNCRPLMKKQKNDYDIFIYSEDDILITTDTFNYWLKYKDICKRYLSNLGFIRLDRYKYCSDFKHRHGCPLVDIVTLDNQTFISNKNSYCAFWIYDKEMFHNFIESGHYNLNDIEINNLFIRETSAYALHNPKFNYFKYSSLIPIVNGSISKDCRVYHLQPHSSRKYMFKKLFTFDELSNATGI